MIKALHYDLHIAIHQEIHWLVSELLPEQVELTSLCDSLHCHLIGRAPDKVQVVNQGTWHSINEARVKEFQRLYKDYLAKFDFFIVGYPSSFALLFAGLGKPILIYNAVRSDLPFCWTKDWASLNYYNEILRKEYESGNIFMVSNNLGDLSYTALAPHGITPIFLPTIARYKKLSQESPQMESKKYIVFGESKALNRIGDNNKLVSRASLGQFSDETLKCYQGIIHFPYDISLMSIFEHYSNRIPMYFPTFRYFVQSVSDGDTQLNSRYWFHHGDLRYPSYLEPSIGSEWITWWLSRADFYGSLGNVNYFDSIEELISQVDDESGNSQLRPTEIQLDTRFHAITEQWRSLFQLILKRVSQGSL